MELSYMINEQKLLLDLLDTLQNLNDSSDKYLSQIGEKEVINPFHGDMQIRMDRVNEAIPPEFLSELGIRSVTLNKLHDRFSVPEDLLFAEKRDSDQYRWHSFRNTSLIGNLKNVLNDCSVVTFSDWALVDGASQLWDGFLSDVIKPLHKKDIHFIFYLGDPTKKLAHEVDEIIDIISDFSVHGQVTFLLNETEALKLWMVLHGQDTPGTVYATPADLNEKYLSIFNAMKVEHLLVYSTGQATLFSGHQQFQLSRKAISNRKVSPEVKDNFDAGYSLGLLLRLDIAHCVALGLTVSSFYLENGASPDREALLSYIDRWIHELEPGDQVPA